MSRLLGHLAVLLLVIALLNGSRSQAQSPTGELHWPLDSRQSNAWKLIGEKVSLRPGPGAQSVSLLGDSMLQINQSAEQLESSKPFTLTIWFCPYSL